MFRLSSLIGAGTAFLAACSLIVDTDGLAGDPADAATIDETTAFEDREGGPGDASTKSDSADARTRFCPVPGAILCDDFDDPDAAASLPGPFKMGDTSADAKLGLESDKVTSAPNALEMTIGSTTSQHAFLGLDFPTNADVRLEFDIDIQERGGNLTVASFLLANGPGFYLQPSDDQHVGLTESYLSGGNTMFAATNAPPIPLDTWVHVKLEMAFSTGVATATIAGVTTTRTLKPGWTTAAGANVSIGTIASSNSQVYYDNVVFSKQ